MASAVIPHVTVDSHLLNVTYAHAIVGAAGLLSLLACVGLWLHLARIVVLKRRGAGLSDVQSRAARFCASQAGWLLLQLLFADLLQALGFVITLNWAFPSHTLWTVGDPPSLCTAQAMLIQLADIPVALFSLLIALHTFSLLVLRRRISDRVVVGASASVWLFDAVLAGIGPIIARNQLETKGPFYCGSSDAFCWVSPYYEEYRLPVHLVWILISAFGALVLYPVIFIVLIRRPRFEVPSSNGAGGQSASSAGSSIMQQMDAVAKRMLVFPIAWLAVALPYIAVRLVQLRGGRVGAGALTVVGAVFALNGLVDVVIYSWTRHLVAAPSTFRVTTSVAHLAYSGSAGAASSVDEKSATHLPLGHTSKGPFASFLETESGVEDPKA